MIRHQVGMLPEWAQTPGGFESLLGIAAVQARQHMRRLVLIVDGLDEAQPSMDGLAFGLPAMLPQGVYVVATYRTGQSPGRPESPAITLPIGKTDPRNTGDIHDFLSSAAEEEVLAARLAEAGMDPESLVEVLTERCGGVWVYLRYVLQEIRLGVRPPDTISDLPSGLRDYYADQIRRWQKDPAWEEALLPLLATLGVAGEPLPIALLARLAGGLGEAAVRHWCDRAVRPLLTTTRASEVGAPLRYEIYHASFREVLRGMPGDRSSDTNTGSYGLEALADELRHATLSAHSRIASSYLAFFGGIKADLPVLAEDLATAGIDDGYPLRHLTRHLQHGDRIAELHSLLGVDHADSNGHRANVWFAAHDHADFLSSYLDDLVRAQTISESATNNAVGRHEPASSLGSEIRYALMAASITSRAVSISSELLDLLVDLALWSAERGLDHARRLTEPWDRFRALLTIQSHLKTGRLAILQEALAAASAIMDEESRALALATLVQLPPDQRANVQSQVLAAASALDNGYSRARVLRELASHLSPELQGQALAVAISIDSEYTRAVVLAQLAPQLSPELQGEALAAASAIDDGHARAEALAALAAQLPHDQQTDVLSQALTAATAIHDEESRALALTGLVPLLPHDQQTDVLSQALTAATAIHDEDSQAFALTGLVPLLPHDQQIDVLSQALTAATAIDDDSTRAEALAALAAQLPRDQQTDVLSQALAAATASLYSPGEALARMAPHLPQELMGRALAAATAIRGGESRAEALTALARQLPPDQQADVLSQALAAATASATRIRRLARSARWHGSCRQISKPAF